jgi:hypothetical protein
MTRSSAEWDWGSWVVGDMADTIRHTADVLGSSFEVVRVSATPPTTPGSLPRVLVVVTDQHTSFRLRASLRDSELMPHFIDGTVGGTWRAEVDELDLTVTVTSGDQAW